MDLSIGDRVFHTRSNGLQPPATVVGTAKDGLVHLGYYQDGLRVVNRQCKMQSISFAIQSSDSHQEKRNFLGMLAGANRCRNWDPGPGCVFLFWTK